MTEIAVSLALLALLLGASAWRLVHLLAKVDDAGYQALKARCKRLESRLDSLQLGCKHITRAVDLLEERTRHTVRLTDAQGRCICPDCQRAHRESIRQAQRDARQAARDRKGGGA